MASTFFRPDMAGRQVLLCVTEDLIEQVGGKGQCACFIDAVKRAADGHDDPEGVCERALQIFQAWAARPDEFPFPPYIGYLALFVLAVGHQGPVAANAYHPRLRHMLGLDPIAEKLDCFEKMYCLWEDLETWSTVHKAGELGVFIVRFAGNSTHVRLPKAQAVLIESERKELPRIFAEADLDPTDLPPDRELASQVRLKGRDFLRQRTLELLGPGANDSELSTLLLDAIRAELEDWDGVYVSHDDDGASEIFTTARVLLKHDSFSGQLNLALRIHPRVEIPEDGLNLVDESGSVNLTCHESRIPGWSTPLRAADGQVDAARFDWAQSVTFFDANHQWQVRFPSARLRIFVKEYRVDLQDWIEVRGIDRRQPFYVAVSPQARSAVEEWSRSGEVDLQALRAVGLSPGWTLYKSNSGALSDASIRAVLPELALPSTLRLRFIGGIRCRAGNGFFRFAPPRVEVEGWAESDSLTCAGLPLVKIDGSPNVFSLPSDLPSRTQLRIEVERDGQIIRRSLFLEDEFDWKLTQASFYCDPLSDILELRTGSVEQPNVMGAIGGSDTQEGLRVLPRIGYPYRKFAIGQHAGEIVKFRKALPALDWQPIWIVAIRRRGSVEYCGLELNSSSPAPGQSGTRRDRRLWKKVLWYWRKRIEPPQHPRLRALWQDFVNRAADV